MGNPIFLRIKCELEIANRYDVTSSKRRTHDSGVIQLRYSALGKNNQRPFLID